MIDHVMIANPMRDPARRVLVVDQRLNADEDRVGANQVRCFAFFNGRVVRGRGGQGWGRQRADTWLHWRRVSPQSYMM